MVNKKACGASGIYGANNSKGCPFDFQNIEGVGIISPSAKFVAGAVNEVSVKALQLAGQLEVLQGVDGVEFTSDEDTITASTNGTKRKTLLGKYQIKVTFVEDFFFQSVLTTIDSFKTWNTFLWDANGNYLFTERDNGDVYGFSTGMISAGMFQFSNNDALQSQTLEFQWTKRKELDLDYAYIDNSELDFDPTSYEGVVQATVDFTAIPSNTDTTILVEALYTRGGINLDATLTDNAQWKVLVNDVEATIASVTLLNNVYTITIPALATGEVVKVSLNGIIDVTGDCLYKSNTATVTVV